MVDRQRLLERFLRYVRIDTTALTPDEAASLIVDKLLGDA